MFFVFIAVKLRCAHLQQHIFCAHTNERGMENWMMISSLLSLADCLQVCKTMDGVLFIFSPLTLNRNFSLQFPLFARMHVLVQVIRPWGELYVCVHVFAKFHFINIMSRKFDIWLSKYLFVHNDNEYKYDNMRLSELPEVFFAQNIAPNV